MESHKPVSDNKLLQEPQDFSIVLGGPLYQLLRRSKLSDDALLLLHRRIMVISMVCWMPLFLLSSWDGKLVGGKVTLPFLWDAGFHIRFLVALPLLIAAEFVVNWRMRTLTRQFMARNLIPDNSMARFNAAIASANRLRNSVFAEVLLIVFVVGFGGLTSWSQLSEYDITVWFKASTAAGVSYSLSPAGMWGAYVSIPIFQFLVLRWYFRLFIWARFLWHVSRIELSLVPTHPDGVGGLGFLGGTVIAFSPVLMAHGAWFAGMIANRIFYRGATLPEFFLELLILVIVLVFIVLGPLLVFAPQLEQARRRGIYEYGVLAERYVREFDTKWLRGGAPSDEPLIGSADIQSLADMGNSFGVVKTMGIVPFSKKTILVLAVLTVAPLVPLGLTMMPLEELLKKLLGILF